MSVAIEWVGAHPGNHKKGRTGFRPESVVIHIMEGSLQGTRSWFNNPASGVSTHYGIGKTGVVHQYVGESDTAFHAGRRSNPTWKGIKTANPNLYTIGIEHEGDARSAWPDEMYESSAALVREICQRWSIPITRDHVIGHREIYDRKTCPGHGVDLEKLVEMARAGAMQPAAYNFVADPGDTRARTALRVREGVPSTSAPVVRTTPAGRGLRYVGWTSNGTTVNGNRHWYRDSDGNWFWAGGTDKPIPGLG